MDALNLLKIKPSLPPKQWPGKLDHLVTDELVEFEEKPVEVEDFSKITIILEEELDNMPQISRGNW